MARVPKPFAILILVVAGAAVLFVAQGLFERIVSDSATRLAFEIRDEAAALRRSGASTRTFSHVPKTWPSGIDGDYRIEMDAGGSIGVGRNLTGPSWSSSTTYHRNFVEVPERLAVAHRKGEPTVVTLELKDSRVLVTKLQ